jgi:hypothetical protein
VIVSVSNSPDGRTQVSTLHATGSVMAKSSQLPGSMPHRPRGEKARHHRLPPGSPRAESSRRAVPWKTAITLFQQHHPSPFTIFRFYLLVSHPKFSEPAWSKMQLDVTVFVNPRKTISARRGADIVRHPQSRNYILPGHADPNAAYYVQRFPSLRKPRQSPEYTADVLPSSLPPLSYNLAISVAAASFA